MHNIRWLAGGVAMAAAFLAAHPASADECQLKQLASLDIVVSDAGQILMPLQVEGMPANFELDIAAMVSAIRSQTATQLRLKLDPMPSNVHANIGGMNATLTVTPKLTMGSGTGDAIFAVMPDGGKLDAQATGILGFDILKNFDVELDLSHNKVNLFSPDHCTGKVIYWTHSAPAAAIPIDMHGYYGFGFPMELDGKELETEIDISFAHAALSSSKASLAFDITDDPPPNPDSSLPGVSEKAYPFKTLAAEGITITNPEIHIYHDASNGSCHGQLRERPHSLHNETDTMLGRCFGSPELVIGRAEIERLRMYFAFRERKLYVTAADAK